MKRILLTGALMLGFALALPAQQASVSEWVDAHSGTKLADLTIGDLKALADQQSVQMQKTHYVMSAGISSYLIPGLGQIKTGDVVGGSLFALGDLALIGATVYGAYTLAPADVVASGLTMKARHDLIENYWATAPEKIAPAVGVLAGGMTLRLIYSIWSAKDARGKAIENVKSGKVTFEPYTMGDGFGMKMRY